jgi:O-acetyl-ADP-ribose deacetylase (regulator of RNase III)
MILFTRGNLLEAEAEALVNTVNTVGVMGKGIALMFKERFPENFRAYQAACKAGTFHVGDMLVTQQARLDGPKWIINFPTKEHWRNPSRIEWVESGLQRLRQVLVERGIASVALPPLGSGNGGLHWEDVKARIVAALSDLPGVNVMVYEPTSEYQNVRGTRGVERLTPPRALVAELVRRYSILGIECSLMEAQKLAYFLERMVEAQGGLPFLGFGFQAGRYGPYAPRVAHLLNSLDGSYLHSDKRLADAGAFDPIRFDDAKKDEVAAYLTTAEAKPYQPALQGATRLIDGFESPLGMELIATVDWLVAKEGASPSIKGIKAGLHAWPSGEEAAQRKLRLFDDRMIGLALDQLRPPLGA